MELFILDTEYKAVAIIDFFESIIWTDRYQKAGDFEIYAPVTSEILSYIKHDYYLWNNDSDHQMIVESMQIDADSETGNHLTVRGRSLESILDRRIVWTQTILSGNFQNEVKRLITENIIEPTDTDRAISNFVFRDSEDERITELELTSVQYTGDTLYDVIVSLCTVFDIGFKITLEEIENQYCFVFQLYKGVDRSYDQTDNPYVIFSPNFENIVNSNYFENKETYKTVTLVAGEGEGASRKTRTVSVSEDTGLFRKELYTDARDISSDVDGRTLTPEEYNAQLEQRGREKLEENKIDRSFDGQVETTQMFIYGRDFSMGDVIQIVNEYGMESKAKVTEMIRSQSGNSYDAYPSFEIIDTY